MMYTGLGMLAAVALAIAQAPARPVLDFKGRLYRAVFVNGPDTLSSGDIAQAPEPIRDRLSRFLKRRSNFNSLYESTPKDLVAAEADAKRRSVERGIISLIESTGIEQRAVAFVTAAPIKYEWEGDPAGPLDESAYAEHVLELEPSTPLAPYLYLFIAQRQRAAAEAAERAENTTVAQTAAAKSKTFLQKARAVPDPIFGLIADDFEKVPFVYVRKKAGAH